MTNLGRIVNVHFTLQSLNKIIRLLNFLLNMEPKSDKPLRTRYDKKKTPVMLTAAADDLEMIKLIIGHEAKIEKQMEWQMLPINCLALKQILTSLICHRTAIYTKHVPMDGGSV